MNPRRTFTPVSTGRPSEGIPGEQDRIVKVGLAIELDDTVPFPLVQVAIDPGPQEPGTDHIKVVATNWEPSDAGAKAIAEFLQITAQAILGELTDKPADTPARPRFNPQPRGPVQK